MSTLHSFFAAEKDLFKGLKIDSLETEWAEYHVLHFDLSGAKHQKKSELEDYLNFILSIQEKPYNITNPPAGVNNRLSNLISTAYENTGRQVVVLIDEYDAPLLDVANKDEQLDELRLVMRNFYSPLKLNEPKLRFVFLTGITKFSQLSIFSELNNINNISMRPAYADICGITKEELHTQMHADVESLAQSIGKSVEETYNELAHY